MNVYIGTTIPKRYREFTPADNRSETWGKKYAETKRIVADCGIALLMGKRGQGKTQAAVCAAGYILTHGKKQVHYTNAFDIFMNLRNGNNANSETTEIAELEKMVKPHLLIIDAFEVRGETAYENRMMNHIIDRRYAAEKPTIIITNEKVAHFASSVGESLIDRMQEGGGLVEFEGNSMRPLAATARSEREAKRQEEQEKKDKGVENE